MGKVIMSGIVPQLEKPIGGIKLSELAEGSIVKINENGTPTEFYVAKHNYESGLNGAGRTLLVRKDCCDQIAFNSTGINKYASGTVDTWLNETYKSRLDANIRSAISTTMFYYTIGDNNITITTLSRSVFLLSGKECDKTQQLANSEGSVLPIASKLQIAYYNGSAVEWWSRTPMNDNKWQACHFSTAGNFGYGNCSASRYTRPCFTIPSNALFDETTLVFKGVA